MELKLKRDIVSTKSLVGVLTVNETAFGFTLEPRGKEIPAGRYKITLTHSNRFNRTMPLINGVAGREGIRLHWGNKPEDSDGCILVGRFFDFSIPDFVGYSKMMYDRLFALMLESEDNESEIWIEIV